MEERCGRLDGSNFQQADVCLEDVTHHICAWVMILQCPFKQLCPCVAACECLFCMEKHHSSLLAGVTARIVSTQGILLTFINC